jgi:uncharacterized SAM-binding protein YcdF (DUF218 family)
VAPSSPTPVAESNRQTGQVTAMTPATDVDDPAPVPSGTPRRFRVRRTVVLALLATLVASLVWVGSVPLRVWWTARQDQRTHSDVLLVLGASQYNGTPSPVLKARLAHALELYKDGVAPRIVTVGGKRPGDRFTEAASGRDWLTARGVPGSAVVAVQSGTDTWNSLQAVDAAMDAHGWDSVVIVTDPWHSFRSREMARHLGLQAATSPTRSGPVVQERYTELRYVVRESGAYVAWMWQRVTFQL